MCAEIGAVRPWKMMIAVIRANDATLSEFSGDVEADGHQPEDLRLRGRVQAREHIGEAEQPDPGRRST